VRVTSSRSLLLTMPHLPPTTGISHLAVWPDQPGTYTSNASCVFALRGLPTLFRWTVPLLPSSCRPGVSRTQWRSHQPIVFASLTPTVSTELAPQLQDVVCHPTTHDTFVCHDAIVSCWDVNGCLIAQAIRARCHPSGSRVRALCVHVIAGQPAWCPWTAFLAGYSDGVMVLWQTFHRSDGKEPPPAAVGAAAVGAAAVGVVTPVGSLLARCYVARDGAARCNSRREAVCLERVCVPVLLVGGDLEYLQDQLRGGGGGGGGVRQAGLSAVSVSADGRYLLAGRVDGSSVRWRVPSE
jgi:hypothetical protein